ncbi:MAG TPA: DUF2071 domain-containing protein [Acidimicrobiales bacterium]|nr:DUF2071 domain-containing protein [Acidimicrobiales bacterium]
MAGALPEERVRWPSVAQSWRHVSFLHWSYSPDVVAALLPAGLEPDQWEGRAWVGLTPFLVEGFRLPPLPSLPYFSRFPETNLRTYVRGPGGVDGIWFFSLDADSAVTVVTALAGTGVPYRWSAMGLESGHTVTYTARRRQPHGPARHRIVVRPGPPRSVAEVSDRDHFLTGRWRAYTTFAGVLATVPVEHQRWQLHDADVVALDEDVLAAAGLPTPSGPPLVSYSPGVDARLGPVRPVRRHAPRGDR